MKNFHYETINNISTNRVTAVEGLFHLSDKSASELGKLSGAVFASCAELCEVMPSTATSVCSEEDEPNPSVGMAIAEKKAEMKSLNKMDKRIARALEAVYALEDMLMEMDDEVVTRAYDHSRYLDDKNSDSDIDFDAVAEDDDEEK